MTDETKMVLARLDKIEEKIDSVKANGCTKADAHARIENNQVELFRRMTAVENAQAEGRGKLAIAILIASALWGMFCIWLGKQIE